MQTFLTIQANSALRRFPCYFINPENCNFDKKLWFLKHKLKHKLCGIVYILWTLYQLLLTSNIFFAKEGKTISSSKCEENKFLRKEGKLPDDDDDVEQWFSTRVLRNSWVPWNHLGVPPISELDVYLLFILL